jgi:hypothetical protein
MIFYFKFNKGIDGKDFSSSIDHAKKSLAKLMDHRIERLSALIDVNQTQLNVTNISKISIERDNALRASDNPCSSTIKVNPILIPKSKRLEINSS